MINEHLDPPMSIRRQLSPLMALPELSLLMALPELGRVPGVVVGELLRLRVLRDTVRGPVSPAAGEVTAPPPPPDEDECGYHGEDECGAADRDAGYRARREGRGGGNDLGARDGGCRSRRGRGGGAAAGGDGRVLQVGRSECELDHGREQTQAGDLRVGERGEAEVVAGAGIAGNGRESRRRCPPDAGLAVEVVTPEPRRTATHEGLLRFHLVLHPPRGRLARDRRACRCVARRALQAGGEEAPSVQWRGWLRRPLGGWRPAASVVLHRRRTTGLAQPGHIARRTQADGDGTWCWGSENCCKRAEDHPAIVGERHGCSCPRFPFRLVFRSCESYMAVWLGAGLRLWARSGQERWIMFKLWGGMKAPSAAFAALTADETKETYAPVGAKRRQAKQQRRLGRWLICR